MPDRPMTVIRCSEMTPELLTEIQRQLPELAPDMENAGRFLENPENLLLLAMCDGQVCGAIVGHRLQRIDNRRAEVLLYSVDVAAEFHRQGIGRAMVETAKRWASEAGADETWVLTNRSNTAAMALYRSTGGDDDEPDVAMFTFR